ncbi:signal recognition particle subunit FFH/SRP54 (srp54) [Candidatus Kryptonium thompsonii]|uniref:Signal recognition particle protein n=2 Tax=Candidatus Kryptonium thompsonii TaxID=1633631 RepID=A0A0P1MNC6_9BACT|nr:signal recognition particle protein [Candidatus Kryptonium thompsoni]CUS84198.1 signal recognition particle subunit FFH/SRP54 (srp54) [Candidatus Kryptonium thompsoni]CUS84540.1 signal recognition particle subunit FFH/SRP54 (srp54) [Candidatus Kryptonium thompsoni]CUS85796.1 signal recognition particle subunit FFH/SRP54 (srp54) [Candidatus Kryptonium thompsoni]CUS92931.1 signal recognition particle subunit FFH/SRP54 (srp54) [Candidatus Kryptonium thompsoni]CUS97055.1 signal recognition part
MFEEITQKFELLFKKIRGQAKITESNIAETMREVRRVMLEADVNYKVVKDFTEKVQQKALGQEVLRSITPGQMLIKIIYDELVNLMGSTRADIKFSPNPPTVIMIVGLQGSGKTTFCAKLANHLKHKGRHPLLVAADIYRPAAIEQLKQLGEQIQVPVFSMDSGVDAVQIAVNSVDFARKNYRDVVIIDTAGRMHIDEEMMREVERIKEAVKPHEILFVVDSMTGQEAVNVAKEFNDRLNFDGVVLTKLDGDARGGAALSIKAVVNKPIKFVSIGEKLDALEPFYPDRMASRILGMGDIVTLVEKAQKQVDEEKAKKLEEKLKKNQFTLEDFRDQIREIRKMGPLRELLSMIPGIGSALRNIDIDEKQLVKLEAIINSMTPEERRKPQIINASRKRRIAMGSGTTVQDVNMLLKQFEEMQKLIKQLNRGRFKGFKLPL